MGRVCAPDHRQHPDEPSRNEGSRAEQDRSQPSGDEALRIAREISRTRSRAGDTSSAAGPRWLVGDESWFAEQLTALQGGPLDLRNFSFRQLIIEQQWQYPEARRALLGMLQRGGHVRPARHFCYETSRDDEQYGSRLGFPFAGLVRFCGKPAPQKVLLELGQGSGACMDGRRRYARTFLQVGCCDVLQYTVRDLLLAALDRAALRRGVAGLLGQPVRLSDPGFWRQLCTFAAKVLVIRPGGTDRDLVPFDEDALSALAADANALVEIVRLKSPLLARTDVVPASEGSPHPEAPGEFVYPRRERKPQEPAFQAACELLAEGGPGYLSVGPGKRDALDVLPVYPCGTILGDFRSVAPRLLPAQVHVAVGVRSTQALDGQEYVEFMSGMTGLLTEGDADEDNGIYVDDNARKNYGSYYPLEELREVERRTSFPLFVVRGRGPEPWEDDVPVAVVATRSGSKLQFVADNLREGFRLQRPAQLLGDRSLMSRLPSAPGVRRAPPT